MTSTPQRAVRITAAAPGPQSRARKQFNTLVKKLEAARIRLALWNDGLPALRAVADSELVPLILAFDARHRQLVFQLDQVIADKKLSNRERKKLSDIISANALELLDNGDVSTEVKALYDKHSEFPFDTTTQEGRAFLRETVRASTGLDLDDDTDLGSPSALYAAICAKSAALQQEQVARAASARPIKQGDMARRQQGQELARKESVRDLFRKLASALHPDRESDPVERARKTSLMQRANMAYAANDLLGLLELQCEIDQVARADLDLLGDDSIRQYNRILQEQLDEIEHDIMAMTAVLAFEMGIAPDYATPDAMMRGLRAEIGNMQADVASIEADLAVFNDIKQLKTWLKSCEVK